MAEYGRFGYSSSSFECARGFVTLHVFPSIAVLVLHHGDAIPGATVILQQGTQKYTTVTDTLGFYIFTGLRDGPASLSFASTGFNSLNQPITIVPDAPLGKTELKMLCSIEMRVALKPVLASAITASQTRTVPAKTAEAPKPADGTSPPRPTPQEIADKAADGLPINGSVNNAATSAFSLAPRFGTTASGRSLYSFSANIRVNNSALDARSYSIAGIDTAKPNTNALIDGIAF